MQNMNELYLYVTLPLITDGYTFVYEVRDDLIRKAETYVSYNSGITLFLFPSLSIKLRGRCDALDLYFSYRDEDSDDAKIIFYAETLRFVHEFTNRYQARIYTASLLTAPTCFNIQLPH